MKKDLENDSEIQFLQRARHPRLVMFLGCGYLDKKKESIFLVLEYCDSGDFSSYIRCNIERSWSERLSLLQDIAEGLEYLHLVLHSIHRDLKSDNVLLSREKSSNRLRAKIADFGLSKLRTNLGSGEDDIAEITESKNVSTASTDSNLYMSDKMTSGVGTPIYMVCLSFYLFLFRREGETLSLTIHKKTRQAPEIAKHSKFSKTGGVQYSAKVDVYAFAIMLWETLERDVPWSGFKFSHEVLDAVGRGERPTIQSRSLYSAPLNYVSLMKASWSQNPAQRPTFDKIHMSLKDIRADMHRNKSNKEKGREVPPPPKPRPRNRTSTPKPSPLPRNRTNTPKPSPRPRNRTNTPKPSPRPRNRTNTSKKKAPPPPPKNKSNRQSTTTTTTTTTTTSDNNNAKIGMGFENDDKLNSLFPV